MSREYRVVWQREPESEGWGGSRRYARFDSLDTAERKALRLQGRFCEAYGKDPDDLWCCPGANYHCGCGGKTWGEVEAERRTQHRPLTLLRIDAREVGEWHNGHVVEMRA